MIPVFLDSTVLVELHFRQRRHAENCREHLPEGTRAVASAYVVFELARGYLTRLRKLHDESFGCTDEVALRELAEKQRIGKRRQSDTWTDVMNDDLWRLKRLRSPAREKWKQLSPPFFRARLRNLVCDGWDACTGDEALENPAGCRADLPKPYQDSKGRLQHDLPTERCGTPGNCGVLDFVRDNAKTLGKLRDRTAKLTSAAKKSERERRVAGIEHLLDSSAITNGSFAGESCHHCGDAMICAEARRGAVVTKDKEFVGLMKAVGGQATLVKHLG